MSSFKYKFQGFWPFSQYSYISEEVSCQTATSAKYVSVTVFVCCVPCELESPNWAAFWLFAVVYMLQ